MKKSVQRGVSARRRCPCFGVLCFLCALISSIFGAKSASADAPLRAIKTTPIAASAAVLGLTNPYLVAAAATRPEAPGFTLSRDIRVLAAQVEKLAQFGVDLNARKLTRSEKLQLRMKPSGVGGVLQICYTR